MKKSLFLFLLLIPFKFFAQSNLDEVVYLKNGSIIRGIIIEQIPNDKIKIQTKDGNVFVYNYDEISKITKEPQLLTSPNNYKNEKVNFNYDINSHRNIGIGLLITGSTLFIVGIPVLLLTPYGVITGPILMGLSIPMLGVGGAQIKKFKRGVQSNVTFSPQIGIHDQVGIHIRDNRKGISVGASLRFSF